MLVMILSKELTNQFAAWNRLVAMLPSESERDAGDLEKQRLLPAGLADGRR